tara:strand:+ start:3769 stop:4836 length:1068 start_codon:yes stop_codon:yes gene_type:complete
MKVSFLYGTTFTRLFRYPIKFGRNISIRGWLKLFLFVPISLLNSVLAIPDFFYKGQRPKQIIFIVGHYRSGTTHLHNLIEAAGNLIAPTTYECAMPAHFLFTNSWLKPIVSLFTPNQRLFDTMRMSVDTPQEDELAMASYCAATPYLSITFPFNDEYFKSCISLKTLPQKDIDDWKAIHLRFVLKLGRKTHGNRGLILKSPAHSSRIQTLLELYPDAKFIHIHRDPVPVVKSSLNLYTVWYEMQSFGDVSRLKENKENTLLETYKALEDGWEKEYALIPKHNRIEVSFDDINDDPNSTIESIFKRLEITGFSKEKLSTYLDSVKSHVPGSYPELRDDLLKKTFNHLDAYIRKYGY